MQLHHNHNHYELEDVLVHTVIFTDVTSQTTHNNGQLLYDIRIAVQEPQHIHQEALAMNQRLEINQAQCNEIQHIW